MFGTHMYGAFPSAHSGSSESIALRGLGVIRLLCAAASGRPFYHHRASGRSVWHRPAEMDYAALLARAQPDTRADEVYRADTRLTEGEILFVEAARGEPPLVPADTG